MAATVYDRHAAFYLDFVDRGQAARGGADPVLAALIDCLGDRLRGSRVLDLCCGEGYAGRCLIRLGAGQVVGVDLSSELIAEAKRRADSPALSYLVDDARQLASVRDSEFDAVISQMAMMDVANHIDLFASVRRVLVKGGPFVLSMLHPCFMAPCHATEAPPLTFDDAGRPVAVSVRRYATEGHWNSAGDGVRGRMGAYHRMISTYVNDLIACGFVLERMEEPLAGDNGSRIGLAGEVPTVLVISARAV
jgi:ubiquinone/menaquinone biosynthesis C-methylase UbiE